MNKHLDRVLKYLNNSFNKERYVEVENIEKIKYKDKPMDNIGESISFLKKEGMIEYNSLKDSIRITVEGKQFINEGGYSKSNLKQKIDLNLKRGFWLSSILLFFINVFLLPLYHQKTNSVVDSLDSLSNKVKVLEVKILKRDNTIHWLEKELDSLKIDIRDLK